PRAHGAAVQLGDSLDEVAPRRGEPEPVQRRGAHLPGGGRHLRAEADSSDFGLSTLEIDDRHHTLAFFFSVSRAGRERDSPSGAITPSATRSACRNLLKVLGPMCASRI